MAALIANTLSGASGLSGFVTCEAIGLQQFGTLAAPPEIIDGRVWFDPAPDGAAALHSRCVQGDELNVGGTRAEITLGDTELLGAGLFNAPFFYTWDMFIPSSWPQTGNPYTVMQIHDWPDDGENPSWPNFELMIQNREIVAKVSADFYAIGLSAFDLLRAPAVFDRWVKCCLFARWDKSGTTGFIELIYDGKTVDKRWNIRSSRDDVKGPYFRLGVYDCLHKLDFGQLDAWYRNVEWRNGADGYVAAMGDTPKSSCSFALSD